MYAALLRLYCSSRQQLLQFRASVTINADGLLLNLPWAESLGKIHAGKDCLGILVRNAPEGVFDDAWRVFPNAQLPEQDMLALVTVQELLVATGCHMPALILHKGIVRAQIHGHGRTAHRAVRHKL